MLLSKSAYIMDFLIWNNLIHIDAINSLAGKMNHKWKWPWYGEDIPAMPGQWANFFSNITVDPINGQIRTLNFIKQEKELFIDYGTGFWEERDEKPTWVLVDVDYDTQVQFQNKSTTFEKALNEYPQLKSLLENSFVIL